MGGRHGFPLSQRSFLWCYCYGSKSVVYMWMELVPSYSPEGGGGAYMAPMEVLQLQLQPVNDYLSAAVNLKKKSYSLAKQTKQLQQQQQKTQERVYFASLKHGTRRFKTRVHFFMASVGHHYDTLFDISEC